MKSEIKKTIEKGLKDHRIKTIRIANREYTLSIFSEDEDINIFDGFLFAEIGDESELTQLKKYRAPVSGYAMRMGLFLYKDKFLIKDYRQNRHILKTIRKVNNTFLKKLRKALAEPDKDTFNKLFDRSDIIEEFYILYKKSREYLLANIKGLSDEDDREVFVDNFMLQMLTLWYLQERGFFNGDRSYFITKFNELKQKKLTGDVGNYYEFLRYFFDKISNNVDRQYHEDKTVGKVVVVGPAIFLNGELDAGSISIPEKCFYKEGVTATFIDTPPKSVSADVPVLNLFESRDWTEGNIDEFVLGALYEKLITQDVRKKTGAYYTPEVVTSYICENTIEPYLVDRINEKWNRSFESIGQIINDGDRKILLSLFEQLKEIKILDPAVGSAHFLESAIDVLLGVYEKIWDRAKELGLRKGLNIIASNRKGEVENFDLLVDVTSREQFRLYVKFFIILSKNIYGVDINRGALKVAKARLFLTLAKHFDANKNLFIRFPNVHFNLRSGNSLVGYVEVMDKPKGQVTIDLFLNEDNVVYVSESIRVVAELEAYLGKTAKALGITGSIVQDIKELNRILSKKSIDWFDFENLLRIKEKLIRILIVSLNTGYAMPLNTLLYEITNLFNEKLNAKFANEHDIDPDDLEKIRTFHWLFEFPEVFVDRGGFDVVVGNPPYLRQESIGVEKAYFEHLYPDVYEGTVDYCVYFMKKSLDLTRKKGYHSFIITNKWLRARYGKKLRKHLAENVSIRRLIDFNGVRVFKGATIDVLLYTIKKSKKEMGDVYYSGELSRFAKDIGDVSSVEELINKNLIMFDQKTFDEEWNLVSKEVDEIKKWIEEKGTKLKDLDIKIYRGILTGFNEAFIIDDATRKELIEKDPKSEEIIKPILRGKNIGRHYIEWGGKYLLFTRRGINIEDYPSIKEYLLNFKDNLQPKPQGWIGKWDGRKAGDYKWYEIQDTIAYHDEFKKSKIIYPDISKNAGFFYDKNAFYVNNTSYFISGVNLQHILFLLNSRVVEFYFKTLGAQLGDKGLRYFTQYVEQLQIILTPTPQIKSYEILADYLLFLNGTEERRTELKDTIDFFDRQLADSLVYELYFNQKFHEDHLYPKPKSYLLDIVSRHLKPIDYDRWSELYWKNQLQENLIAAEAQELAALEKANMRTVDDVYRALRGDAEVQEWIERIRGHEWVKMVDGN